MDKVNSQGEFVNTVDWRTQLPPIAREKIINKITETLKKHLPFSGPDGIKELRRIAARFEEKVFNGAINQTDYLRKISIKMLTMETKSQNAAGSSSITPTGNNINSLPYAPDDWRTALSLDTRQKNANKITKTLKKHVPGQEGVSELMSIGVSFENLIFKTALNQMDYTRKISFKMQIMNESEFRPKRKKRKGSF